MLSLGWFIPVRCGRDRPSVGRETDKSGGPTVTLPNKLSKIQFAAFSHLGLAGVAEMRVVRPDDRLWILVMLPQVLQQRIEGVRHMCIPQVPGARPAPIHRAIVLLRVFGDPRVLFREK